MNGVSASTAASLASAGAAPLASVPSLDIADGRLNRRRCTVVVAEAREAGERLSTALRGVWAKDAKKSISSDGLPFQRVKAVGATCQE
jgi:hypothetical protein